jgi:hypothetical protein
VALAAWDGHVDRFRVARVSANASRWVRTANGWRIAASRVGAPMRKDVDVVLDVAVRTGADLGTIGTVLASGTVRQTVLGAGSTS